MLFRLEGSLDHMEESDNCRIHRYTYSRENICHPFSFPFHLHAKHSKFIIPKLIIKVNVNSKCKLVLLIQNFMKKARRSRAVL